MLALCVCWYSGNHVNAWDLRAKGLSESKVSDSQVQVLSVAVFEFHVKLFQEKINKQINASHKS